MTFPLACLRAEGNASPNSKLNILKPFAFDVTQTALLLFSPSPGGRVRALGRSRNARQSVLLQIKRKTL